MVKHRVVWVALLVSWLGSAESLAGAPPYLPVQGSLTDAAGVPIDQPVDVRFVLYDSDAGGNELWSEAQNLDVKNGIFNAYLGEVESLDLSIFKTHDSLWLGIQVENDPEMPRFQLGTTPFSGFAAHSSYSGGSGILVSADNVISSTLGSSIESEEITDGTILLQDLAANGCAPGQVISWNGSAWICRTISISYTDCRWVDTYQKNCNGVPGCSVNGDRVIVNLPAPWVVTGTNTNTSSFFDGVRVCQMVIN